MVTASPDPREQRVMTNAWQTYQTRLSALLAQLPISAPNWPGPRVAPASCGPTPPASDVHDESGVQPVRLPGISRPECGPLMVRTQ